MKPAFLIGMLLGAAPLSAAAYTAEQQSVLDGFDAIILESGVACQAYELALNKERLAIGETPSRTPEDELAFGVRSLNSYLVTQGPAAELAAMIEESAQKLGPLAREVAVLVQQNVPLEDPRFDAAAEGSAPCEVMFNALSEQTQWAIEQDLYPLR